MAGDGQRHEKNSATTSLSH